MIDINKLESLLLSKDLDNVKLGIQLCNSLNKSDLSAKEQIEIYQLEETAKLKNMITCEKKRGYINTLNLKIQSCGLWDTLPKNFDVIFNGIFNDLYSHELTTDSEKLITEYVQLLDKLSVTVLCLRYKQENENNFKLDFDFNNLKKTKLNILVLENFIINNSFFEFFKKIAKEQYISLNFYNCKINEKMRNDIIKYGRKNRCRLEIDGFSFL